MHGLVDPHEITGIAFIAPQLGTHTYSNPAFRVYDIQDDNYAVVNYHQYRLYLNEANATNIPDWRLAYTFRELYNCTDMQFSTIAMAIERIRTDKEFAKELIYQMYNEGPDAINYMNDKSIILM